MNILLNTIAEGLLWATMALGVYVSYRILNQTDVSAEGTLTLGAAVAASLISQGFNPILATFMALFAGMLAGSVTGLLTTHLRVPALLSGILVMTALYSVNLKIMGRSNVALLDQARIFDPVAAFLNVDRTMAAIILGAVIFIVVAALLYFFLKTDFGQALIAAGDNPSMARAMGIDTRAMRVLGLMIGNGLIALCGSLLAQYNGYADLTMGTGAMVTGLAAIIIAETLFRNLSLGERFVTLPLGSIIYRLIIAFVLFLGMDPNNLKLMSAIVLALFIALPNFTKDLRRPKGGL